ncbi:MAG: adenylate/guanylate cyclase domain-containing protein [Nitrospira sp.]|nr:MAG: adenylate/guanylate cyclase domain-containing protein [Nitrospira sp.]
MTRRVRKRLLNSLAIALIIAGLLTAAYLLTWLSTTQVRSTDFLFASSAQNQATTTVIVGIDQRSYRELLPTYGPMVSWPRTVYAKAVDQLAQAGARVIALDLFFDAPTADDPELVAALARAGNVITPVEAQGPRQFLPSPGVAQEFEAFVRPVAPIAKAAASEGTVNVTTDQDSVIRSLPLVLRAEQQDVPALALAAVARFVRRPVVLDAPPEASAVYAAGRAIPMLESGSMLINYLGPPSVPGQDGPFPIIPLVDIVKGAFEPALVKDKIVLIGLTIRSMDEFATPTTVGTRMWGVEILGNAIETILSERTLVPASNGLTMGLIAALALAAALCTALLPMWATVATGGLFVAYLVAASLAFDSGLLLNMVYPPLALLLSFSLIMIYRVVFEQAEQRTIRGVMARYLSPSVSQWALKDPERLTLGGETRIMTVLFSDLRGFTTLSQNMDPQALTALLNEYMTAMTEIVFTHDGVLDKYIGDAIMAFWNAPMRQEDHAVRACETALDMVSRLQTLQADWAARGLPRLDLGIGINTGRMVVGNMGSRDRLAYTVLGDTVNVGSRLEGLNKEYGTRIVIGEGTRAAAGETFLYRLLDLVAVKGRSEPLAVYEVTARAGQLDGPRSSLLDRYATGLALYQHRRWAEAAACFRTMQEEGMVDGPSALYLKRSLAFIESPPPADWNGVFVATRK